MAARKAEAFRRISMRPRENNSAACFFPFDAPRPQMQTFDEHSECPILASSIVSLFKLNTRLLSRADSHKTSVCGCCALILNVVQFQFQTGTAHASIVSNRVAAAYLAPLWATSIYHVYHILKAAWSLC
jgi:hypothetical protein